MNDQELIVLFLGQLYELPPVKNTSGFFLWMIKVLLGSVFSPVFGAVFCLWLVDTLTGFYYVWTNTSLKLESKKFYHGLVKLAVYLCLLWLGRQCSPVATTDFIQRMIASFIMLSESYSIIENLDKIAKLKEVNIPFLTRIMSIIQGKIAETGGVKDDPIHKSS